MTTTEATLLSVSSPGVGKMEDKKRPAAPNDDRQEPHRKKLATEVNGKSKADRDADMPWRDDLEVGRVNERALQTWN